MFIIYFVVFVAAYFGIGWLCATLGIDLPGDLVLATGGGFVGFQLVQIVLANIVAALAIKTLNG